MNKFNYSSGTNNAFQIATRSVFGLKYNGIYFKYNKILYFLINR